MENEKRINWGFVAKVIAMMIIVISIGILLFWVDSSRVKEIDLKKDYCVGEGGLVDYGEGFDHGVYCDFPSEGRYVRYIVEMDENKQLRLVK